jgi:magnesium transporter
MYSLPKHSAGLLATMSVPTCSAQSTAASVLENLRTNTASFQSLDYIYVLEKQSLIGVFSIHELFSASALSIVDSFMIREVAFVHEHTDKEHVAQLALAQSIKAVPVVNADGHFAGVVLADTILEILHNEHIEDMLKAAGIRTKAENFNLHPTYLKQITGRTPWLLFGLIGGIVGAAIVNFFEQDISQLLFVTAFIPAIVYIADAVGNQSEMLVVRALSIDSKFEVKNYLLRELGVGFSISLILATVMYYISLFWLHDSALSLVLGLSVIATVLFSITFTVLLPWLLNQCGFDPAVASGPVATVVCDISSVSIYLIIATNLL